MPIFGLLFGLYGGGVKGDFAENISPVERLKWFWPKARDRLVHRVLTYTFGGLIFGVVISPKATLDGGLRTGVQLALFFWLIQGIIAGLDSSDVETKLVPNQGIWESARNAGITTLITGASVGLFFAVSVLILRPIGGIGFDTGALWLFILLLSAMAGLSTGMDCSGSACIQHFILRLILFLKKCIPWNYAKFLDYAAERLFLQKVGGGYIFVHRSLMEHFAQLEVENKKENSADNCD